MHDKLLDSASFCENFQPITLFQNFDTPHLQERERTHVSVWWPATCNTPTDRVKNRWARSLKSRHHSGLSKLCRTVTVQLSQPVASALHVTFRMTVRRNEQYKVPLIQKLRLTMAFAEDGGLSIRDRFLRSIEAPQHA